MLENVDMSLAIESNEYKNIVKMLEVKLRDNKYIISRISVPIFNVIENYHK
jgi:hypothetical protein